MANPKIVGLADAGWVQVPADGSGKRIAHYAVDVQQADGSFTTVYYPVLMMTDADGNVANVRLVDGDPSLQVTDRQSHRMLEEIVVLLHELLERTAT